MNKWKRLLLNIIITLPIKCLMFIPILFLGVLMCLAGYEEQGDSLMDFILSWHF